MDEQTTLFTDNPGQDAPGDRPVRTETRLYQGDCLELMKQIPDGSVNMVLCDLPYGITNSEWDKPIPLEPLWGGIGESASQTPQSSYSPKCRLRWIW